MEIEHWREEEILEVINVTDEMVQVKDGRVYVTFPPGLIEVATNDVLVFDECQLNVKEPSDVPEPSVSPRDTLATRRQSRSAKSASG